MTLCGFHFFRDPFVAIDIPEVECKGSCAKIYLNISVTDFSLTRQCLPGCEDQEDVHGYTECCGGNRCNHGDILHSNCVVWCIVTVIYKLLSMLS